MRPLSFCLLLAGLVPPSWLVHAAAPPTSPSVEYLGNPLPVGVIARLGSPRFRLASSRQTLALAPDGKTLAVLAPDRDQVILLDVVTGRELRRFTAGASNGLAFLRHGKELVCADAETVTLVDPIQGKILRRVAVKAGSREIAALSGNGWLLATSGRSFGRRVPLSVYELQTGRLLASVEPISSQSSAALSPDGKWLATWGSGSDGPGSGGRFRPGRGREESTRSSPVVRIWDPTTAKELSKIDSGLDETIAAVTFAPDRKTLALATTSGGVQLWDVASGKRLRSWRGAIRTSPSREALLAFSPDGKTLVLGARGSESPPMIWDLTTGRRLRLGRGPECRLQGVGFPGAGQITALGVQSQAIVLWDLLSGKRLHSDSGHATAISALSFPADGRGLYTSATDGSLIEWDLTGKEVRHWSGPRPVVPGPGPGFSRRSSSSSTSAEHLFSPGGAYLARTERFGGLTVRDLRSEQDVITLSALRSGSSSLAFSKDGAMLAVAFADSRKAGVRLFQMETGEELPSYEPDFGSPAVLAFDPAARRLAVAITQRDSGQPDKFGEVRVYRIDKKEEDPSFVPFSLPTSLGNVSALVFSPDGKFLLVAHAQGVLHMLDHTGRAVDYLDVNGPLTTAPMFSPDGRSLALAFSLENETRPMLALWEMASGKKRWSVPLSAAVTALAFSPTGKVLATGHSDSSSLLWDVAGRLCSGQPIRPGTRLDELWSGLLDKNAERAFDVQCALTAGKDASVAFIRKRLPPATGKSLDDPALARLVKELDADEYTVRQKAFEALAEEGKAAEPHLRKALAGKPSAEVKRRVRELLARMGRPGVSGKQLRDLRALEVLEWIGTRAARQVVEELSRGRADALLTREARATLARMPK